MNKAPGLNRHKIIDGLIAIGFVNVTVRMRFQWKRVSISAFCAFRLGNTFQLQHKESVLSQVTTSSSLMLDKSRVMISENT